MELSMTPPSLQISIKTPHVCGRGNISSLRPPNRRVNCVKACLAHQADAFFQCKVASHRNIRLKSGEGASTYVEGGDESNVAPTEASNGGGAPEVDEEHNQKLQEDIQKKADKILKDAINNFMQSDIEEASKKYDMEEELFAEIDFAQVNAFTERPFAGNPAAVCYLPLKRSDEWLQLVAREFNLSETAFLMKRNAKKKRSSVFKKNAEEQLAEEKTATADEFDLRWFTPKIEVDLCGHATLASAHLLFSCGIAEGDTIVFHTRSGVLKARKVSGYEKGDIAENNANLQEGEEHENSKDPKSDDSEDLKTQKKRPIGVGVVELDFPLEDFKECDDKEAEDLSAALGGAELLWAGKTSGGDCLAEVSCVKEIKQIQPELGRMLNLPGRGVIVTAPADKNSGLDFVSRFFAPKAGVMEDPVTGSAHCSLGPFWGERLGKVSLKAYQASERGGYVEVRVDRNEGRVYLRGSAVLVMAGVLLNTMHT